MKIWCAINTLGVKHKKPKTLQKLLMDMQAWGGQLWC